MTEPIAEQVKDGKVCRDCGGAKDLGGGFSEREERFCPQYREPMRRRDLLYQIFYACTNRECPNWDQKWQCGYQVFVNRRSGREY